jgi:hypothetical protein
MGLYNVDPFLLHELDSPEDRHTHSVYTVNFLSDM